MLSVCGAQIQYKLANFQPYIQLQNVLEYSTAKNSNIACSVTALFLETNGNFSKKYFGICLAHTHEMLGVFIPFFGNNKDF